MPKFCGDVLFEGDSKNGSGDDNSVDSELTIDFESFCRALDDEGGAKMAHDGKEKFSRGSVEVLHEARE